MKRREFIHDSCKALGMTALAAGLGKFNLITAPAQTASDYKALVCIFLFGGNDANNMIVPLEPETPLPVPRKVEPLPGPTEPAAPATNSPTTITPMSAWRGPGEGPANRGVELLRPVPMAPR